METQTKTPQQLVLKPLPLDALDDLHPCFFSTKMVNQTDDNIVQLLKNCEFFRQKFSSPVDLEEFAQLAKSLVTHETYNYGAILLNENDDIDKFYLLIEGKVEKIRQKSPQQKNANLSSNLVRQRAFHAVDCEEAPNLMRRSRLSARFEETFCFNKKSSKMSLSNLTEKETSLQVDENTLRPSLLLKSFGMIGSTTEFETSMISVTNQISSIDIINETERGLDQDDQELKDNFDLHFNEGVLRATKIQTYHSGSFLGDSSAITTLQKSTSMLIVSSQQAHFLVFSRDKLNDILRMLEKKAQERLEVFTKIFPSLDEKLVQTFSSYFQRKYYQKNELIYCQGESAQDIYFLCSGEIRLFKASFNQEYETTVINGQFFGEEALIDRESRQETAVSNAQNTLVYVLNGDFYDLMKTSLTAFFEILTPIAQEKFSWKNTKAKESYEFERNSPKSALTFSSSKRTLPSTNNSPKVNQSTEKRKSSYFYSRASIFSENSPISASETSKISESSPSHLMTEQSSFSRAICKNKNELSALHSKRKFYNSPSRESFPQRVQAEKGPNCLNADNYDQKVKSSKKLTSLFGKSPKNYAPTFMHAKNANTTDYEVDIKNSRINSSGKLTKKPQVSGKTAQSNLVKVFKLY